MSIRGRHFMPKDLKLFLLACAATPLLLLAAFIFLWRSQPDSIVTELELKQFPLKIMIAENQSWLTSEMRFLKATLPRGEVPQLSRWLKRYHRPGAYSDFYMPAQLEGQPHWQPPTNKAALHGYFFRKSSYHWHCSYLIAPVDENTSVFYLYAVDYFN